MALIDFHLVGERGLSADEHAGVLAWLFTDAITQEDRQHDRGRSGRSTRRRSPAKDRPKLKAQIHEALLLANRVEEAAITEAAASGAEIDRRGEADPRAVLGIVGPRPRDETSSINKRRQDHEQDQQIGTTFWRSAASSRAADGEPCVSTTASQTEAAIRDRVVAEEQERALGIIAACDWRELPERASFIASGQAVGEVIAALGSGRARPKG